MPETHFTAAPIPPETVPADTVYKSRLADALYNDPKTRGEFLKLVKKHKPDLRIPEVDVETELEARLQPLQQKILDFEGKQLEREAQINQRAARRRVLNEGFVTEDELPEVEKLMNERNIGDLEAAAELYHHRKQVAAPRLGPTPLRLPNYKGLFADRRNWGRAEAYKVINELAAARNRRF